MSTFKRSIYEVLIEVPATDTTPAHLVDHEAEVRHCDRLRGELEAAKQGLPKDVSIASQNHVTVYVWAALVREGKYTDGYQAFVNRDLVELQAAMEDDGKNPRTVVLDPTRPGPNSGPVSSLPTTTATPVSGSTPT